MCKKRKLFCALIASFMLSPVALNGILENSYAYSLQRKNNSDKLFSNLYQLSDSQKNAFKNLCSAAQMSINENFNISEALKLVEVTQKKFFNRSDKQERWEVSPLEWINKNSDIVEKSLRQLGFFDSIFPKQNSYDAVCILGAGGFTMQARINFAEKLFERGLKAKYIVLLTGERYLTNKVDGTDEQLLKVSNHFDLPLEKLTETHLFRYIYENSNLKDRATLIVIDTAQKDGKRPTTQTTIEDFLKWQANGMDIQKVLFVSNQPSVKYQNAVIINVLRYYKSNLDFETVGEGYINMNLQRVVGELGAYIWAIMPQIINSINFKISDEDKELIRKLYYHQPIFYKNILGEVTNS